MLDRGSRLSVAQATLVGLEAARGLDHAHRQGLVHRDLKPAHLLFGDDERLRIADFGLARALADAAVTEPAGAVLGTARYASPEQAQGRSLSGRSDVYSLALVLIEAVTGEVPFSVDTTIGTLMARVSEPIPVAERLGVLRPVLQAAGAVDPDDRPDAARMATLLLRPPRTSTRPTSCRWRAPSCCPTWTSSWTGTPRCCPSRRRPARPSPRTRGSSPSPTPHRAVEPGAGTAVRPSGRPVTGGAEVARSWSASSSSSPCWRAQVRPTGRTC
jgi:serine/threonine protein kinase